MTADIGPQNAGTIEIPVVGAGVVSGSQLEIRFLRGNELVDLESIQLGEIQPVKTASVKAGPLRRHDQELLSGVTPRIDGDDFSLGHFRAAWITTVFSFQEHEHSL